MQHYSRIATLATVPAKITIGYYRKKYVAVSHLYPNLRLVANELFKTPQDVISFCKINGYVGLTYDLDKAGNIIAVPFKKTV